MTPTETFPAPHLIHSGLAVLNGTPHPLLFAILDEQGDITEASEAVPPSGMIIYAGKRQALVDPGFPELVTLEWMPVYTVRQWLKRWKAEYPTAWVLGSLGAAEAYSDLVVSPTPIPGQRGRKEKILHPARFTVIRK